ncbi:DEAD/DEAH box helicase [Neobacillus sp. SM06]|uniref:DEAD/DEAH box helicase n=1 Tax=Neobacillus sp. SM06 TaxID=3422492 RepID=UPI003D2CAED1
MNSTTFSFGKNASVAPMPVNSSFKFTPEIQKFLTGKQLLLDDIPFSHELIQTHYENGYIRLREGIIQKDKHPVCVRCGNSDPQWFAEIPCARCGQTEWYCRNCLMMGRMSECTRLFSWNGPVPKPVIPEPILEWSGQLSEGQTEAADRVVNAIRTNSELLVWAVCGAGKTEILFQGIAAGLAAGNRICIATPRTDVVLELTPRLKKAFPAIAIASLFGGSEERHLYAPLTITTTHQLMRFYHAFDVIILDEVDAFPFTVDESLKYAAAHARKPVSTMIYLTATPNEKWQRECRLGKRAFVTIPARFHRHPLPVPEFVWSGNWQKQVKKGKFPASVRRWISTRLQAQKQALVFFPHIPLMEKALPFVRQLDPNIETVHAEDPKRKEKVEKMRSQEISILLTTTILERGVTIPNIDVAVIGAEDDIFTESALVQIAGRAGRSVEYPSGNVTFFHYGKTAAMQKARRQIVEMNRLGRKKGLIDA